MEQQKIKSWLDRLQQDSWELEFLISGFAIFALVRIREFLYSDYSKWFEQIGGEGLNTAAYVEAGGIIIRSATSVLLSFLALHIIIRGIWVGALGLRFVSGGVNFDSFNFSKPFRDKYAKKKDYFDSYILRLEKIASILFSYAFLVVFITSSFMLFLVYMTSIILLAAKFLKDQPLGAQVFDFIVNTNIVLGGLVLIDFVTLGALKKIKWKYFAYPFFYISEYVALITLSFIWRPLWFNFLDNKKTKYALIIATALLFLLQLMFMDQTIYRSAYFPTEKEYQSANIYSKNFYVDDLKQNKKILNYAIPSKIIEKPYLELFVKAQGFDFYIKRADSSILTVSPKEVNFFRLQKTERDQLNKKIKKEIKTFEKKNQEKENFKQKLKEFKAQKNDSVEQVIQENFDKMLTIMNRVIDVKIDSTVVTTKGKFYRHPNNDEFGLLYIISLDSLQKGNHTVSVGRDRLDDVIFFMDIEVINSKPVEIPFYYLGSGN